MTVPLKIFVVGCGRSGTHWLGYTLASHPDIVGQIEVQPAFGMAHEMAWDPFVERDRMHELFALYDAIHARIRPKHFADKSHSALWLVQPLAAHFPEARFVAIRRRVLPTVASMLNHAGVLSHYARWNANPGPNRFLGVTDVASYAALPIHLRCALRVIASSNEIQRLAGQSDCRIHVIEYDQMQSDPTGETSRLADFLDVADTFNPPAAKPASLVKWKTALSAAQIQEITHFAESLGASHLL